MTGQANDSGEQAWRAAVDTALKGSPFERLTGRLAGGIAVDPIYPADSASRSRALRTTLIPPKPTHWLLPISKAGRRGSRSSSPEGRAPTAMASGLKMPMISTAYSTACCSI